MRRPDQQRNLPHKPKTAVPHPRKFLRPPESEAGWPPRVGRALYALGLRYVTLCPDRSPVAMQCFGLVAHDRILTGDMRHAQA